MVLSLFRDGLQFTLSHVQSRGRRWGAHICFTDTLKRGNDVIYDNLDTNVFADLNENSNYLYIPFAVVGQLPSTRRSWQSIRK